MTQTWSDPGGDQPSGSSKQAGRPSAASVTDLAIVERARRRWKLHKRFTVARRISVALDQRCGVELPELGAVQIDYAAMGFDLGFPERCAAGLALLERERAA
jgi:hypothetical protein